MEHLYFTKVDKPPQDRRKKKGFVPRGDSKSNIQHGEELLSQVKNQVTENNDDIRRFRFEPHLVMKVELEKDAILSEANISKLESMGLKVIDTEEKELMVLFADDYELKEFNKAINDYKQGVIARTKIENEDLFCAIKGVSRWDEEDRKGQDIDELSEVDYIDCYLWIFDSLNETQKKADEFIKNTEGNCVKYCDKYISQTVAVVRLKIQKNQLPYFLKHPLVYKIDRIPSYHIKRTERTYINNISLSDIKYNSDFLTEKSSSICVIDSGILSGHPLLKDAIGDSKTFYVTDGYTANENDIAGHGTMVAGICEYGIIHPEDTFVPRIYLYSAKIHDGEYIGDFALCKQELDDEKIEINMEQEEILYNYFSGKITQEQLFEKLELKTRVPETKSIIKKYGIEAYDYDIQNEFNETDHVTDLFKEIEGGYQGEPSLFDKISPDDLILAFFPCTRFEQQILLWFRGDSKQQKNDNELKKLEKDLVLHSELSKNYSMITKLAIVCLRKNIPLVFENPYSEQHYLQKYWCLKPTIIDRNRRDNGDYYNIVEAMKKSEDNEDIMRMLEQYEDYPDRRFYDHYRYANGRFAPKGRGTRRGYVEPPYYHQMPEDYHRWEDMSDAERMRDLDRMSHGKMYYSEPMSGDQMSTGTHDAREGRAGMSRRSYIETKELHNGDSAADKDAKMKELEKYMKSLSEDVTELFSGMSPEEKQLTKKKLTTLVTKM